MNLPPLRTFEVQMMRECAGGVVSEVITAHQFTPLTQHGDVFAFSDFVVMGDVAVPQTREVRSGVVSIHEITTPATAAPPMSGLIL